MIETLLAHGADPHARTEFGDTSAHYAALGGTRQVPHIIHCRDFVTRVDDRLCGHFLAQQFDRYMLRPFSRGRM